ncbi:arthropsin [Brachionus plicatilis]|uniref:Arthropsin n=1 Tax=Brachionus plicatilis TaxID=10195 RepID=A0A3M7SCR3_BRAPC|nr:arthropsin [Brachionus plicatilis]
MALFQCFFNIGYIGNLKIMIMIKRSNLNSLKSTQNSWTPYALVSMYSAFIDEQGVSPLAGTLPAIVAKSSMLWTALVYIFSNKNIRTSFLSSLKIKLNNSEMSHSRNNTAQKSFSQQQNSNSQDGSIDSLCYNKIIYRHMTMK